ncbi:MAG TPA: ABC transporter permease [Pyrinomonadaceae bacterium]|nr:ABC transporter permease [Pyrinomonadaceae bacterium]
MMKKLSNRKDILYLLIILTVLIAAWSLLSASSSINAKYIPSPLKVLESFGQEIRNGRLFNDIIASLFRVSSGYLLGVVTAIPVGLLLGHYTLWQKAAMPFVNFFRNLSPLTWIPFAILWFGIGDISVIFLILITVFFPLVLATTAAVANISKIYFRVAEDLRFTPFQTLTQVTFPAILPELVTALRVTAGISWLVVVAAEMIAGSDGLGYAVWDARNGLRIDLLIVEMIVIGILGIIIDRVLTLLSKNPRISWVYEK